MVTGSKKITYNLLDLTPKEIADLISILAEYKGEFNETADKIHDTCLDLIEHKTY